MTPYERWQIQRANQQRTQREQVGSARIAQVEREWEEMQYQNAVRDAAKLREAK